MKTNANEEYLPTPKDIDICLDCEDWRVKQMTRVSNTNPVAIDLEYIDISEAILWKPS
jgi:hypothetical protein